MLDFDLTTFVIVSSAVYVAVAIVKAAAAWQEKELIKPVKVALPVLLGAVLMPVVQGVDFTVEAVSSSAALGMIAGHTSSWTYEFFKSVLQHRKKDVLDG